MGKNMIQKYSIGEVVRKGTIDSKNFTAEVIMSDETLDRYDEIIRAEGYKRYLKQFMKHPILMSSHRYGGDLRSQIGEWQKVFVDGKQLVGVPKYYVDEGNPEADWAWKMVEKGMAAYSVGIIPKKMETMDWEKWSKLKEQGKKVARRVYLEQELIECSHVLIPANPAALQRSLSESQDEGMRDVVYFFFSNLDKISGFGDVEITESDIAEKFLIKELDEDGEEIEEEEVEEEDEEVVVPEEEKIDEDKFKMLEEKVTSLNTTIEAIRDVVIGLPTSITTIETSLKQYIDEKLNVKAIVPNDTYIENILSDGNESDEVDTSVGDQLNSVMESLRGITNTLKSASEKKG